MIPSGCAGPRRVHLQQPTRAGEALHYCPDCSGNGEVEVTFADLPSEEIARGGDGYDWISAVTGWTVIALWGDDGYDLGQWPYQALAVCPPWLSTGPGTSYGMATYCEGDVDVTAHRTYLELEEAIARYAHGVWRLTENGPSEVPDRFEDLAEEFKRPYGGRPLGIQDPGADTV
jgi:hypothetical protein